MQFLSRSHGSLTRTCEPTRSFGGSGGERRGSNEARPQQSQPSDSVSGCAGLLHLCRNVTVPIGKARCACGSRSFARGLCGGVAPSELADGVSPTSANSNPIQQHRARTSLDEASASLPHPTRQCGLAMLR